ncbi:MAG: hypothetical protein IPP22_16665 [Nitrosomonas sp.]|nr:hypothetical protein [Nitrosomonas sp.]
MAEARDRIFKADHDPDVNGIFDGSTLKRISIGGSGAAGHRESRQGIPRRFTG